MTKVHTSLNTSEEQAGGAVASVIIVVVYVGLPSSPSRPQVCPLAFFCHSVFPLPPLRVILKACSAVRRHCDVRWP